MKTISVTLGELQREIKVLPIKPAQVWRKTFEASFNEIVGLIDGATDVKLDTGADLGKLLLKVKDVLLGAVDKVPELVFAYSPELAAQRDWIENNASDEEAVDALLAIVGVAYPFGALVDKFRAIMPSGTPSAPNGSTTGPTVPISTN